MEKFVNKGTYEDLNIELLRTDHPEQYQLLMLEQERDELRRAIMKGLSGPARNDARQRIHELAEKIKVLRCVVRGKGKAKYEKSKRASDIEWRKERQAEDKVFWKR
jgi:hypothetical protein